MNQLLFLECSPADHESLGAQQVLAVLDNCNALGCSICMTTHSLAVEPLVPLPAQYARAVMGNHNVQFVYLPGLSPTIEVLAQTRLALASFLVSSLPIGDLP